MISASPSSPGSRATSHHKRGRPKQRRAGRLLCKPQKLPSLKKAERRHSLCYVLLRGFRATQERSQ